jgi:hypothetical protein
MEANAKKPKAKARPKLNPTENAALKRLEQPHIACKEHNTYGQEYMSLSTAE